MHDLNNKIKEQKDLIVQLIEKDVSINDIIVKKLLFLYEQEVLQLQLQLQDEMMNRLFTCKIKEHKDFTLAPPAATIKLNYNLNYRLINLLINL